MPTLHRHALSGHSHRAQLFLSLIGEPAELVDVDLAAGAHKAPAFRALNPLGQVPVLQDGDTVVADSNAILVYLAESRGRTDWYPTDPALRAEIQRWLSVAANQIANGPAAARLVTVFGAGLDHEAAKEKAHAILGVVEGALAARGWLVGERASIADLALYSYIAHAPEGDVSLEPYPAIRAWLARIEALEGFVPMQRTAAGLAA
ncbi:MAG: glutathione S-transferase [Pseudomonadota bacterium]